MKLVSLLRTRNILIDQISLFPGPEKEHINLINYFYPIKRLHVGTPSPLFTAPYQKYGTPKYLLTFFPTDEAETLSKGILQLCDNQQQQPNSDNSKTSFKLLLNKQSFTVIPPLQRRYTMIRERHIEGEKHAPELPYKMTHFQKGNELYLKCYVSLSSY